MKKKNCGNCGNAIAENGRKKKSLRQWHCRNRGYKFLAIVAMALPKMGGKKKGYEICERVKKKVVMSTICLQHFHNIVKIV